MGLPRKDITKEMILQAMANTRSNRSAARYLHVSYQHYKKWAKLYDSTERKDPSDPNSPFKSLFEKHLNPHGKGIPKFLGGRKGNADKFPILDIIEGRVSSDHFSPKAIKESMIREGLLREMCCDCGFGERRVTDFKMPLLLYFKDNNKRNYSPGNCVLKCYNCYFLTVADVFTERQELSVEDHKAVSGIDVPDWELDEYQKKQLDEITRVKSNIPKNDGEIDKNDLISRPYGKG